MNLSDPKKTNLLQNRQERIAKTQTKKRQNGQKQTAKMQNIFQKRNTESKKGDKFIAR